MEIQVPFSGQIYYCPIADLGRTLAHEVGHNLGMWHDFDPQHGGNGRPGSGKKECEGKGTMSYGDDLPAGWSDCSKRDLQAHYNQVKCPENFGPTEAMP